MKVYDYHCASCGHEQEVFVRHTDDEVFCEVCGEQATRLPSAPAFDYMHMGLDYYGMPSSAAKWEKNRKQEIAREKRLGICEED